MKLIFETFITKKKIVVVKNTLIMMKYSLFICKMGDFCEIIPDNKKKF